jgi:hypothetical protein
LRGYPPLLLPRELPQSLPILAVENRIDPNYGLPDLSDVESLSTLHALDP